MMDLSRLWALGAFIVLGIACLALGLWLRAVYAPEWRQTDTMQPHAAFRPWMVEADCYSQMARVQRILHGQGLIQNHFAVENWPDGLVPSTTAPFDYAILLLYAPLCLVTQYPLDWAGVLVSPLLWVALVAFWMIMRSREFNLTGRSLLLIGSAALPAFIWATAYGRPRHQSLIIVLLAMGLTAEFERWHIDLNPKRAWNIFAGLVWGLACWTSLFEPPIIFAVVVLFNLVARRRESTAMLISFGFVMLIALLLEGVHIYNVFGLSPDYRHYLVNWLNTIGEIRGISFAALVDQMTLVLVALPFLAWALVIRENGRTTDIFLVVLTTILFTLTVLQSRWIYYSALAELFVVARFGQAALDRGTRFIGLMTRGFKGGNWPAPADTTHTTLSCAAQGLVLLIYLVGLADADATILARYPHLRPNLPSPELAQIARSIDEPGAIMAPWWLSPGLLYFSGHPIVSGSSHCGITGIVASAKFYTTTSWTEADRILKRRPAKWIVAYDDPALIYPVLNSSAGILGVAPYTDDDPGNANATVAQILSSDQMLPTNYHLRAVTPTLKLYEYTPDAGR
jgi:hypothetical protein